MGFDERRLNSEVLGNAFATFEIIEAYAGDKYLPSYLLRGEVPIRLSRSRRDGSRGR
jgi:hypothetical protein